MSTLTLEVVRYSMHFRRLLLVPSMGWNRSATARRLNVMTLAIPPENIRQSKASNVSHGPPGYACLRSDEYEGFVSSREKQMPSMS